MASIAGPLAQVARAMLLALTGVDYFIEMGAAATDVEWAAAMGAHFAPFDSDEYSEVGHARFLVALQSGVERKATSIANPTAFSVAKDLLVVDNEVDVMDFVQELGNGDLARFRTLVRSIAAPDRTPEEIEEVIDLWNRQIRAYERRPDRLRSMGLTGLALGTISKMAGAPDLISLSATLLPMVPAGLTYLDEDLLKDRAALSSTIDAVNARLAGVHRDSVLLARMKKLVKGMK